METKSRLELTTQLHACGSVHRLLNCATARLASHGSAAQAAAGQQAQQAGQQAQQAVPALRHQAVPHPFNIQQLQLVGRLEGIRHAAQGGR